MLGPEAGRGKHHGHCRHCNKLAFAVMLGPGDAFIYKLQLRRIHRIGGVDPRQITAAGAGRLHPGPEARRDPMQPMVGLGTQVDAGVPTEPVDRSATGRGCSWMPIVTVSCSCGLH